MMMAYLTEEPNARAIQGTGFLVAIVYFLLERGMARYADYPGFPGKNKNQRRRRLTSSSKEELMAIDVGVKETS